ncbi:hypothetical protein, partial [Pseudomonas syringae]|uniref:hypothetical protein n=1 Tax=Pseudomonas syringae TaxID=317 RepID=UPI001C8226F9
VSGPTSSGSFALSLTSHYASSVPLRLKSAFAAVAAGKALDCFAIVPTLRVGTIVVNMSTTRILHIGTTVG